MKVQKYIKLEEDVTDGENHSLFTECTEYRNFANEFACQCMPFIA